MDGGMTSLSAAAASEKDGPQKSPEEEKTAEESW